MSNISSNSIFHFTRTENTLKSILTQGLRFSPVGEKIPGTNIMYLVDALCFCDIPLSAIREHVEWYGSYAIGFKPSFVKANGGTPVCYVHSSTVFLKGIKNKLDFFSSSAITPYLKQNYGQQHKRYARKLRFKNFYDEKEWRIVDSRKECLVYRFTDREDIRQAVSDEKMATSPRYLAIDYSMIDYIILKEKKEVALFKQWLQSNGIMLPEDAVIISAEKILKDF